MVLFALIQQSTLTALLLHPVESLYSPKSLFTFQYRMYWNVRYWGAFEVLFFHVPLSMSAHGTFPCSFYGEKSIQSFTHRLLTMGSSIHTNVQQQCTAWSYTAYPWTRPLFCSCWSLMFSSLRGLGMKPISHPSFTNRPIHQSLLNF